MSNHHPQSELKPYRPFYLVGLGGLLLWASFPPLELWPLVFLAIASWLVVVVHPDAFSAPRSFRAVWLVSFAFWLGMDYFVTMPHWAGYFGWLAMSAYLSIYIPFFFASSRALVHRFRLPLVIAAPLCWVAMEWLRAHIITGYGMGMLPHSLYRIPLLIQTADLAGGYVTSFLLVALVASALRGWQVAGKRRVVWLAGCVGLAGFMLAYGAYRLQEPTGPSSGKVPIGLIQASRDVRFELNREAARREWEAQFREYRDLTVEARKRWPDLALILWPESAFPGVDYIQPGAATSLSAEEQERIRNASELMKYFYGVAIGTHSMNVLRTIAALPLTDPQTQELFEYSVPLLTGGHAYDAERQAEYNSAFLFDRESNIIFRYQKMHLVMFGEYVPLGDLFPFVYRWMPIPGGLAAGAAPQSFELAGLSFTPSICFESTVGHLIRNQVITLAAAGREPDVLVNLTNDGWFYGTNCLDLHLACNVFRAVEMRKPVLVAANTGFSAHIDGCGRLLQRGPRRQTAVLRAEVECDGRSSPYLTVGDTPGIVCTIMAVVAWLFVWLERKLRLPPRGA